VRGFVFFSFLILSLTSSISAQASSVASIAPVVPAPQTQSTPTPSTPELDKKIQDLNLILDNNKASAAANAAPVSSAPNFLGIFIRLAISLGVVLALIWALYRVARKVRRMDMPPSEGGKALQMIENYFVGPNQKILLMRVGETKVLLLGATQTSIQVLTQIEGEEAKMIMTNAKASVVTPAQFSETVNQMLSRFRKDGGK